VTFSLRCARNCGTRTLHAKYDEPSSNVEFLQPCPIVAAGILFEVSKALSSTVLSLNDHWLQTNTFCVPKFVTNQCSVVLLGTSLSRFALLSGSRTATDYFDAK
jgi:hypothetical protein